MSRIVAGRREPKQLGWAALTLVVCATMAWAAEPLPPFQVGDAVDQSIARAKAWLYSQQHDGNWETPASGSAQNSGPATARLPQQISSPAHLPGEPGDPPPAMADSAGTCFASGGGGRTALATYALLAIGESSADPRLQSAVEFLSHAPAQECDAVGLRCQVWAMLPARPQLRVAAGRDAFFLEQALMSTGPQSGASASAQGSGILGLWACARSGIAVPHRAWENVESTLRPGPGPSAQQIALLLATREFLHASEGLDCMGNLHDAQLDDSMSWLGEHAADLFTPEYDQLWALSRIGSACGCRRFGKIDWYQRGIAELLKRQQSDGSWGNVPDTALALLFCAQGRAPVVIAKLNYNITPTDAPPKDGNWNQRPMDVANTVAWISHRIARPLNWRIVGFGDPDWEDAPVLYISGNQDLQFTQPQLERLRNYALAGGLILGHADASSSLFTDSFQALGEKLFPNYKFRPLPANHPMFTQGPFAAADWREPPQALALGNGCRELMVLLSHGDPARQWQTLWVQHAADSYADRRAREAVELAADILAYAADPSLLPNRPLPHAAVAPPKPAYCLSVARLRYQGNWNPEPVGWTRLADWMRSQWRVDLSVETVDLGENKLPGYRVAHLVGTGKFELSESARIELRQFVNQGGTLILEAGGGSKDFTASAEAELLNIFGDKPTPQLLDMDSPAWSVRPHAQSVHYRAAARRLLGNLSTPQLRGLEIDGRVAVYLSDRDLSAGLTGVQGESIDGYDPPSADAVMCSLLLSTAAGPVAAAPAK